MKITSYNTAKSELVRVPLPEQTRTYKPITHKELMDLTLESIHHSGFELQKESYTMAREGQIANGTYTISNVADKDMQIQIGWQNSYNKQVTLKFAIGVHVFICANGCISGDMGAFKRKHTGDVQEFTPIHITEYIKTAGDVFVQMQGQRDVMKNIEITKRTSAELLGRMYVEEGFLNSVQMNIIKGQIDSPSHDYGAKNSLWELYQFVTYSLKNDHPASWMQDHIKAHEFFTTNAGILVPTNEMIPIEIESPYKQLDWVEEVNNLENHL